MDRGGVDIKRPSLAITPLFQILTRDKSYESVGYNFSHVISNYPWAMGEGKTRAEGETGQKCIGTLLDFTVEVYVGCMA